MSGRPPVLGHDLVERLKGWSGRDVSSPRHPRRPRRLLAAVARPVRRVVVRLVDPSLRATLDQLRHQADATGPGSREVQADVEVLRAELRSAYLSLAELGRRVDAVERALAEGGRPPHL